MNEPTKKKTKKVKPVSPEQVSKKLMVLTDSDAATINLVLETQWDQNSLKSGKSVKILSLQLPEAAMVTYQKIGWQVESKKIGLDQYLVFKFPNESDENVQPVAYGG